MPVPTAGVAMDCLEIPGMASVILFTDPPCCGELTVEKDASAGIHPDSVQKERPGDASRRRAVRFLARCLAWRQYASNHHGTFDCRPGA